MSLVKTFVVEKRGRKYFQCRVGGYAAKLLINNVSSDIEVGNAVRVRVVSLCETGKYGTKLLFEPVEVMEICGIDKLDYMVSQDARVGEAMKWLEYAEGDVQQGMFKSNAIVKAINLCRSYPFLSKRLSRLEGILKSNKELCEARTWLRYAWEDVNKGLLSSNAIRMSNKLCPQHSSLSDSFSELKKVISGKRSSSGHSPSLIDSLAEFM